MLKLKLHKTKLFLLFLTGLFTTSSSLLFVKPAPVSAVPFSCQTGFYQMVGSLGSQLVELDTASSSYTPIGAPNGININAIGYSTEDNYIYGISNAVATRAHLIKIHDDGSYEDLGLPTGLPNDMDYIAGDFDDSGNLYVFSLSDDNTLYSIDVSGVTSTTIPLSEGFFIADLVFMDGLLYGLGSSGSAGFLIQIDASTGTVTPKPISGTPTEVVGMPSTNSYGSGWSSDGSRIYFLHNRTGIIYEATDYESPNPAAVAVYQGPISTGDGASCSSAPSPVPALAAVNDSYNVENGERKLTVPASSGLLRNDSGQTITVTDYTQPDHGEVNVSSNGSFTYTAPKGFSGIATFTYTITDEFGQQRTASVTILVPPDTAASNDTDTLADTGTAVLPIQIVSLFGILSGFLLLGLHRKLAS